MDTKIILLESDIDDAAMTAANNTIDSLILDDESLKNEVKSALSAQLAENPDSYDQFVDDPVQFTRNLIDSVRKGDAPTDPDTLEQEKATNLMKLTQAGYEGIVNE